MLSLRDIQNVIQKRSAIEDRLFDYSNLFDSERQVFVKALTEFEQKPATFLLVIRREINELRQRDLNLIIAHNEFNKKLAAEMEISQGFRLKVGSILETKEVDSLDTPVKNPEAFESLATTNLEKIEEDWAALDGINKTIKLVEDIGQLEREAWSRNLRNFASLFGSGQKRREGSK